MPRSFARSTGKRYVFSNKTKEFNVRNISKATVSVLPELPIKKSPIIWNCDDEKKNIKKSIKKCLISKKDSTLSSVKSPEIDSGAESDVELLIHNKNNLSCESDDSLDDCSKDTDNNGDSKYSCLDCGKSYSTQSNLSRHKQIHRSPNDKKAKTCPDCGKVYVSIPAYSMHVRTHNQNCLCPICGSSFSRPWLLQGHLRTHTGERPYKCQICGKDFADRSNLRAHKQTHSQVKPYQCELCNKRFALKSYLSKHKSTVCTKRF